MSSIGRSDAGRGAGLILLLACAAVGGGCGPSAPDAPAAGDRLRIGAYSVVREALHDGLLPAFKAHWKKSTGRDVAFEESYNASGAQARAIRAGFDADVAILSLADDMDTLVKAGLVGSAWDRGPTGGILTRSLVVIGHRPGNPKAIAGWADLARPGVGVLYPDPKTSGGAKWNVGAVYGQALLASKAAHGGTADAGEVRRALAAVQANVINMDQSGRQSVATFERGVGDALVTYENELLLRRKQGREIPYLIPDSTLVIESPAALVDAYVDRHKSRAAAEGFLAFLLGPEGQAILAEFGFRPVRDGDPDRTGRPLPPGRFTIADLGGWPGVNADVFGPKGAWTATFRAPGGPK